MFKNSFSILSLSLENQHVYNFMYFWTKKLVSSKFSHQHSSPTIRTGGVKRARSVHVSHHLSITKICVKVITVYTHKTVPLHYSQLGGQFTVHCSIVRNFIMGQRIWNTLEWHFLILTFYCFDEIGTAYASHNINFCGKKWTKKTHYTKTNWKIEENL